MILFHLCLLVYLVQMEDLDSRSPSRHCLRGSFGTTYGNSLLFRQIRWSQVNKNYDVGSNSMWIQSLFIQNNCVIYNCVKNVLFPSFTCFFLVALNSNLRECLDQVKDLKALKTWKKSSLSKHQPFQVGTVANIKTILFSFKESWLPTVVWTSVTFEYSHNYQEVLWFGPKAGAKFFICQSVFTLKDQQVYWISWLGKKDHINNPTKASSVIGSTLPLTEGRNINRPNTEFISKRGLSLGPTHYCSEQSIQTFLI